MSDRPAESKGLIAEALDALDQFPDHERAQAPDELQGLARQLDYARVVIERTDPELVPAQIWDELSTAVAPIRDEANSNPPALVQSAQSRRTALSNALAKFPVARGRLRDQALSEILEEADRRARARTDALEERLREQGDRADALEAALAAKEEELQQYVNERKSEMDGALSEATSKVNEAQSNIENALTSQADDFRSAQEERAGKFNDSAEERDQKLNDLVEDAQRRTAEVVEAAEQAMQKATSAEGALGLEGTSERYRKEADGQGKAANGWRLTTVVIVACAVAAAIWAASAGDGETEDLIGRLAIGVALGALATYTARQSGRHRDREEDTREIALDLAAFNSFIEPLSDQDVKDQERRELGQRIFGQQLAARNRTKHAGPALGDQVASKVVEQLRSILSKEPAEPPASH